MEKLLIWHTKSWGVGGGGVGGVSRLVSVDVEDATRLAAVS